MQPPSARATQLNIDKTMEANGQFAQKFEFLIITLCFKHFSQNITFSFLIVFNMQKIFCCNVWFPLKCFFHWSVCMS